MRSTPTHVFFWFGPFSNWHKPSYFAGKDALTELLPRLDELGVIYPVASDPITVALATHRYNCGEQWMMAAKAWLFGDSIRLAEIQNCVEPKIQKALGRNVTPFNPALWLKACVPVVAAGSIARFAANPNALQLLLDTEDRVLVEGSPFDRLWGVGISWESPKIEDPRNWRGLNLFGEALAIARAVLRARAPASRRFSR